MTREEAIENIGKPVKRYKANNSMDEVIISEVFESSDVAIIHPKTGYRWQRQIAKFDELEVAE